MTPSHPWNSSSRLIPTRKGISRRTVLRSTASGVMTAARPRIIRIFRILLPIMLPMVISALPFRAADMLTAASGALVPIATMVRPIIRGGIFNFAAISDAPSTNQSAPLTRRTNPTASRAS